MSVISKKATLIIDNPPPKNFPSIPRGTLVQSASKYIEPVRFVKSNCELKLAQDAADISDIAFRKIMNSSRPDISEHYLSAELEWECRKNNAQRLAYPPVVAGGDRALTIHYIKNDKKIK